ncbi:MAG: uncharacterized protein A8A55_0115 [Amphiamblys sp. WSBS2006]|nr:MAG: uncharacterized protein A8A55_0115 [Amphiamblys sp. WSBS2006]
MCLFPMEDLRRSSRVLDGYFDGDSSEYKQAFSDFLSGRTSRGEFWSVLRTLFSRDTLWLHNDFAVSLLVCLKRMRGRDQTKKETHRTGNVFWTDAELRCLFDSTRRKAPPENGITAVLTTGKYSFGVNGPQRRNPSAVKIVERRGLDMEEVGGIFCNRYLYRGRLLSSGEIGWSVAMIAADFCVSGKGSGLGDVLYGAVLSKTKSILRRLYLSGRKRAPSEDGHSQAPADAAEPS